MGTVVLLNGASSSGKTAIARELQARWDGPMLLFGVDDVISMMPLKYTGEGAQAERGFLVKVSSDPVAFAPGAEAKRLNELSAGFVSRLAIDFDIVLDYVFTEELLDPFVRELANTPVLFCGVHCSLMELEARERARGNRTLGLAARQAESVHFCRNWYDLDLDSSNYSPAQLASSILEHLNSSAVSLGLARGGA